MKSSESSAKSSEDAIKGKEQNKPDDFTYLEPYQKITTDTRYHNVDRSIAPRSAEQLMRNHRREQMLFIIVMALLLLLFVLLFPALYYFGEWEPPTQADADLRNFFEYLIRFFIIAIAVIVLFYFTIRGLFRRLYLRRMIAEYELESTGAPPSKESNQNLCNSCMRLIDDSAAKCPYCGAEVDLKKHLKPAKEERATTQEIVERLPNAIQEEAKSYIPITFLVIILIILFGLLFHALFFGDEPIRVQLVLSSGSVIVGMYCILGTTYISRAKFMSSPYLWQLTVPVARKASFSELFLGQTRWLVMSIFCLLVFFISLLIPF